VRRGRVDVAMGWIRGTDASMDLREPCPHRPYVTLASYRVGSVGQGITPSVVGDGLTP